MGWVDWFGWVGLVGLVGLLGRLVGWSVGWLFFPFVGLCASSLPGTPPPDALPALTPPCAIQVLTVARRKEENPLLSSCLIQISFGNLWNSGLLFLILLDYVELKL